jgi:hypothetical protein
METASDSRPRQTVFADAEFRIRIHRIHKFLGLLDPDSDLLGRDMDPDPHPSHKAKIVRKTLISTVCDFFLTFYEK